MARAHLYCLGGAWFATCALMHNGHDGQPAYRAKILRTGQNYIDSSLGSAFVGSSLSCIVFGILSTQLVSYFRYYPSDKLGYKLIVILIWILETVDQIFIGHAIYFYAIKNYATPEVLLSGKVIWTLILQLTIGALAGLIVKTCFALRVWRFSNHNRPVTFGILFLIYGHMGLVTAYTIKAFQGNLSSVPRLKVLASCSLGLGALTDILIALSLCYFLRKLRTGSKKSDTIVNQLTIYALNTGGVTSAISLTTLILYNIDPNSLRFVASYFVLSKLYAVSLMATLNTRKIIRGQGFDRGRGPSDGSHTFEMVHHRSMHSPAMPSSVFLKSQMEISVHQEVSVVADVGAESTEGGVSDDYQVNLPAPVQSPRWR
ncbi:hypothetical protein HGRIS_006155 [Hohenbuehelia grisea]|uniref:DUF6534 domain-containing protein n=1 Tax=Hohenbuehelia grisea TaxID=104357 RepID=A0ABR3K050_9AGAR